jgi:hypothetical protein
MTTTDMTDATRALIASTQRMLDDAARIKSPRELGIVPDTRRNFMRAPRLRPVKRKFIR